MDVSYESFMKNFVLPFASQPRRGSKPNYNKAFDSMPEDSGDRNIDETIYQPFASCIQRAKLCANHRLVITQNGCVSAGVGGNSYMDAALFLAHDAPTDGQPHYETQNLWIHFRSFYGDPYEIDPFEHSDPDDLSECPEARAEFRKELQSYMSDMLYYQHRQFVFSVLILSSYARLVRWDRAAYVVTERFDYKKEPKKLAEFLHLFCRLPPERQGSDLSATPIKKGSREYKTMLRVAEETPQDYVREAFKRSLNPERQRWKITEDTPNAPGPSKELRRSTREQRVRPKERHFLVGEPIFRLPATPSVFDVGTRGYVAFDTQDKTLVYLKDQWRIDYDEKIEGDVIRTLNSKGVGHVPTLVCHGDVRDEDDEVQTSSNQIYWNTEDNVEYYEDVPMMIHYRLVQKEVPCPLKDFGRSYDLVKIVSDCLQGHQEALEKAGILHRDVSERNVMCIPIEKTGPDGETHIEYKGILCDWSLATDSVPPTSVNDDGVVANKKKEREAKNQKRTRRDEDSSSISSASSTASSLRVGTWKFMSIRLSDHRMRLPTVQDDLESFFYVLLYEGVRYLSHNCPNVTLFIDENFDQHGDYGGRHVCSAGKRDLIRSNIPVNLGLYTGQLAFRHTDGERAHPLNALVTTLTSWFKAYYDICYDRIELKEHVKPMRSRDTGKYRALRGGTSDEESDTEDIELQNQKIDEENQRSIAMMEQNRMRVVVLKNHDAMLALFCKALSRTGAWPKGDKVGDQLGVKERPPL